MPFSIQTNMGALNAYNALLKTNDKLYNSQLKIATTRKINTVGDDVSGYNVSKSLEQKVALMKAAQGNISSAKDMLATAESALGLIKDKLSEIRSYISSASDPTKDRKAIAETIVSIGNEIKQIFDNTKFNNTKLLEGTVAAGSFGNSSITYSTNLTSISQSFTFQTGVDFLDKLTLDFAAGLASTGENTDSINLTGNSPSGVISSAVWNALSSFTNLVKNAGGVNAKQTEFATAIASLEYVTAASENDTSIIGKFETAVDDALTKIGNFSVRLDVKNEYLTNAITNATSSIQNISDTNVAEEQLNVTKLNIASQLATAMLSSMNSQPQNLLQLFQ